MKKICILLVVLITTVVLWASNTITYKASSKLTEVTDKYAYGLHTDVFNIAIASHDFSNGTGTITFAGDVTTIGKCAFYKCSGLTSITIPNSVTTIGEYAFSGCENLTSVTIPNSVKTIGRSAFSGCKGLKSITIPNSVTMIGGFAFSGCSGLTSITIPNSVTTIGKQAFGYCSGLTSITIPNSVTSIEVFTFRSCFALTSVTIPNSVTTIGGFAFDDCSGLTSITIPNSVTTIGEQAFGYCRGLTSITIPNSVTTIGELAFKACSGLTSVTIPNSVKTIGRYAFWDCSGLTSVAILNPNVKIGEIAFYHITDLYCGKSVDLSQADDRIKNIHRLSEEELQCLLPLDQYAKGFVEPRINEWQKKGEFEKTSDWQKRVTETTRKQKIDSLICVAKKDYLTVYKKYKSHIFTLGTYDADNEVYLVQCSSGQDLLMAVPFADASYVKQNWANHTASPQYDIQGTEVVVTSVDFTFPNKKTYTYKSTQDLTYAKADIQYNFDPIELNLGTSTAPITQPNGQQTIQQKQLTIGKSAVDTNIPITNTKNANTFVVIIANENYQSVTKVPFANNDGEILSQYCNKTLGIPTDNIHIYKDATYNNMRSAMAWLETVCRSYDGTASVIFYYTGHGIPDESNKTAYLLPVDGDGKYVQSGIALDEIYSKLGAMPSKSITVLLDACFSGATRDGAMLASAKGVAIKVKKGTPLGNTVALAAAQGDETAGFYEEQGHGLFTYFLLKKLQETKGDITLEQLSNYITTEVKRRSAVQGKIQTPSIIAASAVADSWQGWRLK